MRYRQVSREWAQSLTNTLHAGLANFSCFCHILFFTKLTFKNLSRLPSVTNRFEPNQAQQQNAGSELGPFCLQMLSGNDIDRES